MTISLVGGSATGNKYLDCYFATGYLRDIFIAKWYQFLNQIIDCFSHPVTRELDTCGLRCPLPLLKAKQALRDMSTGEVLRVLATDAGSVRDFKAYAQLSGQELLAAVELNAVYCYLFKKSVV